MVRININMQKSIFSNKIHTYAFELQLKQSASSAYSFPYHYVTDNNIDISRTKQATISI